MKRSELKQLIKEQIIAMGYTDMGLIGDRPVSKSGIQMLTNKKRIVKEDTDEKNDESEWDQLALETEELIEDVLFNVKTDLKTLKSNETRKNLDLKSLTDISYKYQHIARILS